MCQSPLLQSSHNFILARRYSKPTINLLYSFSLLWLEYVYLRVEDIDADLLKPDAQDVRSPLNTLLDE